MELRLTVRSAASNSSRVALSSEPLGRTSFSTTGDRTAVHGARPTSPVPRTTAAAHAHEIDDEDERLIRLDHASGSALAVGEMGRDRQAPAAADPHTGDA